MRQLQITATEASWTFLGGRVRLQHGASHLIETFCVLPALVLGSNGIAKKEKK
jgi:hypothetical protein